jgi:trans-aconitate 2-methyltransferase
MDDWDPQLYNRFRRYRAEPVAHILQRLDLAGAAQVADLGCGSGENTIELARRAEQAAVRGLDRSPAMIEAARKLLAESPENLCSRVTFAVCDLARFCEPDAFDVIFSNAAFHWITDQPALFAACLRSLRPGGQIVAQIPANNVETAKREIAALAESPNWAAKIGGLARDLDDPDPEHYARMLTELGYERIDCCYHTFAHPMDNARDVVQWYRSTGLRPFLAALPESDRARLLDELAARLERAYGTAGAITFNFRRLFIWGRRPASR